MILHNLKVAVRNLMKYKLQTAISVLSIAVGIVTLAFTHSLISRFRLPAIFNETYYDRAYQLEFFSVEDGQQARINNDIIRAIKKDGGPRCVEKIAVPNGQPGAINAEFHLLDSTIRRGHIFKMIIDPAYADYAGFRSAITGKKIKVLKAGEAIISENFAKRVFQDKNPIGAIQMTTQESQQMPVTQLIPVTIVDVYKSLSVTDSPIDNDKLYFCTTDNISDVNFDEHCYAVWVNVVLKKGFTKTNLENEINHRIKHLGLKVKPEKVSDNRDINVVIAIQMFGYIIGVLILFAAIIGFLRIEIQLFHIRRRELALRIVNGANFIRLYSLLFTEIFVSISISVIISLILGVMLQDYCDTKLNLIVNNIGITISNLWVYSLVIGSVLIAICSFIAWLTVSRICNARNVLAKNIRGSRNHLFRNIMLGVQMSICLVFVCCTFILINAGNKVMNEFNEPDNINQFKEYLYFQPTYSSDKKRLIDEIKLLPDLDESILLNNNTFATALEIKDNQEVKEKLNGHIYFQTYFTNDTNLISKLGMKVEWFNRNIDRNNCLLLSENLYRQLKNLGVLDNDVLTMDISWSNGTALPIAGIIKSIAYDMDGKSILIIQPTIEDYPMDYLLIPKPGKGAALARSVDETVNRLEPELINKIVSNYIERMCALSGFVEAVKGGGLILGCVSLLICAMSIFSTVALDTRARRKEVAIRKVNGAKRGNIYRMFGKVYIILTIISLIIAIPACLLFNMIVESLVRSISSEITLSTLLPIALGSLTVIVLIFAIISWQIHLVMKSDPSKIITKE